MKAIFIFVLTWFIFSFVNAQSFNQDKVSFSNFLKRMYESNPFEGVKVVEDYDSEYLVSVVRLERSNYSNESTMIRVAQVKAQSQANIFLNGSIISMDMIITTKQVVDSVKNVTSIVESIERIKENSVGFSKGLELLTIVKNENDGTSTFIYIRELNLN